MCRRYGGSRRGESSCVRDRLRLQPLTGHDFPVFGYKQTRRPGVRLGLTHERLHTIAVRHDVRENAGGLAGPDIAALSTLRDLLELAAHGYRLTQRVGDLRRF